VPHRLRNTETQNDTICAIATPTGTSAIGVIRISGHQSIPIAQSVFKGKGNLHNAKTHTILYGEVYDKSRMEIVDEAVFLIMKGPHSYTGEDVVEIQSHGNPFVLHKILTLLLAFGARLAVPGEFSRRAFLSGRIDLAQAEAIMEMISSHSEGRYKWAIEQLRGKLSGKIHEIRGSLLALIAQIEASINFSEEGLSFDTQDQIGERIHSILKEIQSLISGYEEGRKIRDGFFVVIVGRPNVGKSSLLNLLLKEERAIVTPYPGTTRDTLEEWVDIDGLTVRLIDTAGYRETSDPIESEGVRRGEEALKASDVVLWVIDGSEPVQEEDRVISKILKNSKKIVIVNKSDLPKRINEEFVNICTENTLTVRVSTVTTEGLSDLKSHIKTMLIENPERERPLVALLRHKAALSSAENAICRAVAAAREGVSWEFIAADLRMATDAMGDIVGETTTDEILDQIFSQFCIGK